MGTEVKTQSELYDIAKTEAQTRQPELTDFNEGSTLDVLAGMISVGASEVSRLIIEKFNKTFVNTSHGPEVTGGPDDLQTLLVDHFGNDFARPAATFALGVVTFSRANTSAGPVLIPAGSVVKTKKDSNGQEQRFLTQLDVTLTGLSINASVVAAVAGIAGNVGVGGISKIESALTDSSVIVANTASFVGGASALNDANYREFARLKIETIRGGTLTAIQSSALLVSGIVNATAIEAIKAVKEFNIATGTAFGNYFYIPYVQLFVADANGTASQPLVELVKAAIKVVRSAGVVIEVVPATALLFSWDAVVTFNPLGPNFSVLNVDPTAIKLSMQAYIQNFAIGADFVRADADSAIMAIYGPLGTNDLVSFHTVQPVGDVITTPTQKLIPGVMGIV
jgi:hypothetical protein